MIKLRKARASWLYRRHGPAGQCRPSSEVPSREQLHRSLVRLEENHRAAKAKKLTFQVVLPHLSHLTNMHWFTSGVVSAEAICSIDRAINLRGCRSRFVFKLEKWAGSLVICSKLPGRGYCSCECLRDEGTSNGVRRQTTGTHKVWFVAISS